MNDELVLRSIWYVINKSGLRAGQEKKSGRYETQTNHGFRKRWTTIIENVEGVKVILAEKMMGHSIKSIPMAEIYNLPTTEMLFAEYKKAIPELVIDDSARKQAELDNVNQEKSELQERLEKNQLQKDEIERLRQSVDMLMKDHKEKTISN